MEQDDLNVYVDLPIGTVHKNDESAWRIMLHYMKPILDFYETPGVTEIMINRYDKVFIEQDGKRFLSDIRFQDESELNRFITQVAVLLNQVFDEEHPILDARFPDCSRLCCTHSNVTPTGATVTIRIAPKVSLTSKDLLSFGALTGDMLGYIEKAVIDSANMMVSGGMGSGKTTFLRMLTEFVDPEHRIITCEDTQELHLNLSNQIAMEAPKRREGRSDVVSLPVLIKTTLRQAPTRIWVGEIRDAEAADAFIQCVNVGHGGCATTIHSNGCLDTISRLQYIMSSSGRLSYDLTRRVLLDSVHVLVHAERTHHHGRKITEIYEVIDGEPQPMFIFDESVGQYQIFSDNLNRSRYK